VTGYGVVKHKPEEAHIAFLVSTTAASAVMALSSNAAQVQKVISGLKDHGVPEGNIIYSESSLINVPDEKPVPQASASPAAATPGDVQIDIPGSPPGQESPGPAKPAPQFTANARVEVVTYEVGDASSIVQIGMYAGATGVIAMTFEPRDLPEKKQEALILAMKDAANKAEILSVGIKSKILYVISVSEISAGAPATPGIDLAPPAEVAVPGSIEVIYAIG